MTEIKHFLVSLQAARVPTVDELLELFSEIEL